MSFQVLESCIPIRYTLKVLLLQELKSMNYVAFKERNREYVYMKFALG